MDTGKDDLAHESCSIFIGQMREILMKGVSVREMEAAKQIMAAYGKWEKYLSEWRHDSNIPESYHTGIT